MFKTRSPPPEFSAEKPLTAFAAVKLLPPALITPRLPGVAMGADSDTAPVVISTTLPAALMPATLNAPVSVRFRSLPVVAVTLGSWLDAALRVTVSGVASDSMALVTIGALPS